MKPAGRAVLSHGPIILTLSLLAGLASLCSIAALIVSLTAQSQRISVTEQRINFVQAARSRAAEDSCFLVRGLVLASASPKTIRRAQAYINATQLRDCQRYGQKVAGQP